MSWLTKYIEKPIRKEVKLLRDNGFNTESSCGHVMSIQCSYFLDGELKRLHDLLFNNGYKDYSITVVAKVIDGHLYQKLMLSFKKEV